jgi:hypothetical protein
MASGGGTVFDPLSLGEGWGEGLSTNCNHSVAADFSPQSVREFFAALLALKNSLVARLDNGLKPGELFSQPVVPSALTPTLSQRRGRVRLYRGQ